jgi:hypothetical protein
MSQKNFSHLSPLERAGNSVIILLPGYLAAYAGFSGLLLAGVAQLAEHNVANVVVEGPNPFARSLLRQSYRLPGCDFAGRCRSISGPGPRVLPL